MRIRLFVIAVLVASTVLGCTFASRNPPTSHDLEVPMNDVLNQHTITQNVTVGAGHTLKITLGSNFTTPYRWLPDMKIGDSTIVKQTDHGYVKPTNGSIGAAGNEVWTFTALKAGTTTVTTSYSSFISKDTACTYTAIVTVQ